jgi:hypothetical protein
MAESINNTVTTTRPIAGKTFWDDEGACYRAEKVFGCNWYYVAHNIKALGKGYVGQPLYDFYMPKEVK